MELFANKPHLGQQVRHLTLYLRMDEDERVVQDTIVAFQKFCPNIKSLNYSGGGGMKKDHNFLNTTFGDSSVEKWTGVEVLIGSRSHLQITRRLITNTTATFTTLTNLHVFLTDCRACFDNFVTPFTILLHSNA